MYIERAIKYKNHNYYIRVDVGYCVGNAKVVYLKMKNFYDDYYDAGDFNRLVEKVQESYTVEKARYYDKDISYMGDILYFYDRIPFLIGIRSEYISEKDNLVSSTDYISREEIEDYIKLRNVKMHKKANFHLMDERTWFI